MTDKLTSRLGSANRSEGGRDRAGAVNHAGVHGIVPPPATAQTFTVLHEFGGLDGAFPEAPLVQDAAGNLYGTTAGGGSLTFGRFSR